MNDTHLFLNVRIHACLFKEHKHLSTQTMWLLFCLCEEKNAYIRKLRKNCEGVTSSFKSKPNNSNRYLYQLKEIETIEIIFSNNPIQAKRQYDCFISEFYFSLKPSSFMWNYLFYEIVCHACSHISKTNKSNIQ